MDTLMHADIFFFITTIAVVVWTLALVVVAYFAVRALRKAEDATEGVRESRIYRLLFNKKR